MEVSNIVCLLCIVALVAAALFHTQLGNNSFDLTLCDTPFGELLGTVHGVVAYSNCNCSYIHDRYAAVSFDDSTSASVIAFNNSEGVDSGCAVYSGLMWQCVEFARRYLLIVKSITFGDVDGAEDIWSLESFHRIAVDRSGDGKCFVDEKQRVPFQKLTRGSSDEHLPRAGDLVIWSRQHEMPYGHVAVVVDFHIESKTVGIAEQNFHSVVWKGNSSRRLHVVPAPSSVRDGLPREEFTLLDPFGYQIIGWIRSGSD